MRKEIAIIMGSQSDWEILQYTAIFLDNWQISYKKEVISAHRTPNRLIEFALTAAEEGIKIIIAGAGGAAHLPGMLASATILPVIGVPIPSTQLMGVDSLLSIVQMPKGVPVATVAIGKPGAINAAILALQILALTNPILSNKLQEYKKSLKEDVNRMNQNINNETS